MAAVEAVAIPAGLTAEGAISAAEVLQVTGKSGRAMKNISAEDFFTPGEQEQIRLAVKSAEDTTSGEIATMVIARSDSYLEAITLGSVLGAATLALLVAIASHHVTVWSYLPLTIAIYFPFHWLVSRVPLLQKPFISGRRLEEAVKERAVRAFYEKGLYRTRDETGILIFISLFEHKVWILGDRGINARIPPESWQQLVKTLASGIREGRACEALCKVIKSCGDELSRHFPKKSDDIDELQNEILIDGKTER
jgi:putative membrane protein